jgi:hypothetical protein
MGSAVSKLLTIGLVALVAVLGSIGGRAAWDAVTAEEKAEPKPPPLEVLNEEAAKPKFEGEILGVFIGPYGAQVPEKFTTYEELCGEELTVEVDDSRAGELWLDLRLPEPFVLDTESLNTGVIACGDTVYAARWDYNALQPSGYPGHLLVVRSPLKYSEFEVSAERVHSTSIAGVDAVYIEPLSENGISSMAGVIFPGESVTTEIQSEGIPKGDLLRVAELVAAAIKSDS